LRTGRPIALEQVGRIVEQLCSVLEVLHGLGMVHGDLKPSNLMLVGGLTGGEVSLKVLNSGLAKSLGSDKEDGISHTDMSFGTASYMSPELFRGNVVDARSDIYAAGIILYEILTGKRPFEGSLIRVVHDHLHTPPPPFRKTAPECRVPPAVEGVVMRCLEKDPARRPRSARALYEEFFRAMGLRDARVAAAAAARGGGTLRNVCRWLRWLWRTH
jgi:serine/threonine-protein kinase